MTLRELAKLVAEMRNAQRQYFRTRSLAALEGTKRLEKQREALEQPTLFGDGHE